MSKIAWLVYIQNFILLAIWILVVSALLLDFRCMNFYEAQPEGFSALAEIESFCPNHIV